MSEIELADADEEEYIEQLMEAIHEDFHYYKSYHAKVAINLDPLKLSGGVLLEVPEIGAIDALSFIRAEVMQAPRSASWPAIDDTGIVFFVNADCDQARFIPDAPEAMIEPLPLQKLYTIVETSLSKSSITVDELLGGFTINSLSPIGLISVPEPTVLGDGLAVFVAEIYEEVKLIRDELKKLFDMVGTHTHIGMIPTSPPLPPVAIEAPLGAIAQSLRKIVLDANEAFLDVPGFLYSTSNLMN